MQALRFSNASSVTTRRFVLARPRRNETAEPVRMQAQKRMVLGFAQEAVRCWIRRRNFLGATNTRFLHSDPEAPVLSNGRCCVRLRLLLQQQYWKPGYCHADRHGKISC